MTDLNELYLPDDLIAFLQAERDLECDWSHCEAGRVWLKRLADLHLGEISIDPWDQPFFMDNPMMELLGTWMVPAVSLVDRCEGCFRTEGILVWYPTIRQFGQWDSDHDVGYRFVGVNWTDIVREPLRFLNHEWTLKERSAKRVVPWRTEGGFFREDPRGQ